MGSLKYYIIIISLMCLLCCSAWSDFLPVSNVEKYGLKYGESIAGIPINAPTIDGKLDDWKHAIWVAFDSKNELFRGQGAWKGKDDLSVIWSTMYDSKNFYFAAAVWDDVFAPSADAAQPWLGDCIFLYIDWENTKAGVSSKPNFAMIKNKAIVADYSGKNPQIGQSQIAIVPNALLGKGGIIYEVAMPFEFLTKVKIVQGTVIGFTPGYEDGTNDPEGRGMIFMVWGGLNPDEPVNLGKLTFGDKLAVNNSGKLAVTWGGIK